MCPIGIVPGSGMSKRRYLDDIIITGISGSISKSVSETEVNLDLGMTNLTYTIEVVNGFATALGGVVVTDALPAGISFVSSVPPASQTNGNEYLYDVGVLETNTNFLIITTIYCTPTHSVDIIKFSYPLQMGFCEMMNRGEKT